MLKFCIFDLWEGLEFKLINDCVDLWCQLSYSILMIYNRFRIITNFLYSIIQYGVVNIINMVDEDIE